MTTMPFQILALKMKENTYEKQGIGCFWIVQFKKSQFIL